MAANFKATPVGKALTLFESALIRAWVLDTEDGIRDKHRRATETAHAEAEARKRDFVTEIVKLMEDGE